jgi:hypothetical protein
MAAVGKGVPALLWKSFTPRTGGEYTALFEEKKGAT